MFSEKRADVFCDGDLNLNGPTNIFPGNLYVHGNLNLDNYGKSHTLEVLGDLYVDGIIYADEIHVHGKLYAGGICGNYYEVDDDIVVSSKYANKTDYADKLGIIEVHTIHCLSNIYAEKDFISMHAISYGSISASSIDAISIISGSSIEARNGDVTYSELVQAEKISAKEEIYADGVSLHSSKICAIQISSKNLSCGVGMVV